MTPPTLPSLEAQVREALGHPFWIDLGLADAEMDLEKKVT